MPISAIVISLSGNESLRRDALRYLKDEPSITLGEASKNFMPAVLETQTINEGAEIVKNRLTDHPGIEFVRVISVDFSDLSQASSSPEASDFWKPEKIKQNFNVPDNRSSGENL